MGYTMEKLGIKKRVEVIILPGRDKEIIRLENVGKIFAANSIYIKALENVNLSIYQGEFLCIVGPSGCGKTTLLRILAGLEEHSEGKVIIKRNVPEKPLNSMVFQGDSLFPWMNIIENVSYGLRMQGKGKKERYRIAENYLAEMGLKGYEKAYPYQLSGGMKQRVSVARAFASDPEILLMDEPFGALDEQNKILLQQELLKIWEETRKTTIFITHSIDEALILGDRVIVMTSAPGRVKATIDVGIPRPRDFSDIRSNPVFIRLYQSIWKELREEVLKTRTLKLL